MQRAPTTSRASSVGVELSALRDGAREEVGFVAFVLSVLAGADGAEPCTWSLRAIDRRNPAAAQVLRRPGARLHRIAGPFGAALHSRWVAPPCDVVHLASGPLELVVDAPAVITVHREIGTDGDRASRRTAEQLLRACDRGVVLHATTVGLADYLIATGLPRESVVVAVPGIVGGERSAPGNDGPDVEVLVGTDRARALATLHALGSWEGVRVAELAPRTAPRAKVLVVATSTEAFPHVALEAMSTGCAVVAPWTRTNGAMLAGAARLVESPLPGELADAAIDLALDDAARSIMVTAGRTRATDFTVARRGADLLALYARSARAQWN